MTRRASQAQALTVLAMAALAIHVLVPLGDCAPLTPLPWGLQSRSDTVVVLADGTKVRLGYKVVAEVEKGRILGVVERRGDLVEVQVCVGTEIRRGTLRTSEVKFLADKDMDLASEWLKTCKEAAPGWDLQTEYRARLDGIVNRVANAAAAGKTGRERARLIGVQIFDREGFAYRSEVFAPDQLAYLKRGNCFSLSLLYLCVGKKLALPLHLVVVPQHAFVRYDDGQDQFCIEATNGTIHDSDRYIRDRLGSSPLQARGGIEFKSLRIPRTLGPLFCQWGALLARSGKNEEACAKFAKAVEVEPRDSDAYCAWGLTLAKMGKEEGACDMLAKAVEANPRDAATYRAWGAVLAKMGRFEAAREKLVKADELAEPDARGYFLWGLLLMREGRRVEAIEKFNKATDLDPSLRPEVTKALRQQ